MFLRLLAIVLLVYVFVKIIGNAVRSLSSQNTNVKGSPKKDDSLNLSDMDVEDAKYKDIDE